MPWRQTDRHEDYKLVIVELDMLTSTMVVLAALHMGWLKFLAVFLTEKSKKGMILNQIEH